jgi:hypothetical protein
MDQGLGASVALTLPYMPYGMASLASEAMRYAYV